MKPVYFILIFFTLASASAELETWRAINTEDVNVDFNKIVDKYNPFVKQFMINHGLDPLILPDNIINFSVKLPLIPIIQFNAELALRFGALKYLSQLERYGNSSLSYNDKRLKMDIGFEFALLQGSYNYAFKLLLFTSKGQITASLNSLRTTISVIFDTSTYTLTLNSLKIESINNIKADIHTKLGLGWLITPITNAVLPFFKSKITSAIEVEAANTIQTYFKEINPVPRDVVARILGNELMERYFDEGNNVLI